MESSEEKILRLYQNLEPESQDEFRKELRKHAKNGKVLKLLILLEISEWDDFLMDILGV